MHTFAQILAVCTLAVPAVFASSPTTCTYDGVDVNGDAIAATWDLSNLMNAGGVYAAYDHDRLDVRNFTYIWSFCRNVPAAKLPATCQTKATIGSPAWQVHTGTDMCYTLGQTMANKQPAPIAIGPIEPDFPARGIRVSYIGGETCGGDVSRKMDINMYCADKPFPASGLLGNTDAREVSTCEYALDIYSHAGCPSQCKVGSNGQLCSGQGLCDYDADAAAARCFCFEAGDSSSDCSDTLAAKDVSHGSPVGAAFGGVFVAAAAVGGFAYYQYSKGTSPWF